MADIRTIQLGRDYETNIGSPCLYYSGFSIHLATWGPAVTMVSATTSGQPPGMSAYVCPGASSALYMIGVPFATGVYTFTIDVLMSDSSHIFVDCVHTVAAASGCPVITPSDASPPLSGKVGIAFSQTIYATGGVSPYTWDLVGAPPLPPGLSISSAGVISGTPTAAGTYSFSLRATDANGCQGSKPYVMVIATAKRTQIRGRTQIKPESIDDLQIANPADIKHRKLQGGAIPYIVPDESFEEMPWVPGSSAAGDIKSNGAVAFVSDQSMGNNKLTNVKDATDPQDAVNVRTAENISVLTNGDATTPEIMFDATGDVIMTGI